MKGVGKQFVPLKRKDNGVVKTDAGVYRSSIGCLLYLIATMPDIMLVASLFSWFMQSQNEKFNWDDGSVKTDVGVYWGLKCCLLYLIATRPSIMFAASLLKGHAISRDS